MLKNIKSGLEKTKKYLIISLLSPYYLPIISLLSPYYLPIISLLSPYYLPTSTYRPDSIQAHHVFLPLLFDCCSIVVRLLSDCCPIKYRTTNVIASNINRTTIRSTPFVTGWKMGGKCWLLQRLFSFRFLKIADSS